MLLGFLVAGCKADQLVLVKQLWTSEGIRSVSDWLCTFTQSLSCISFVCPIRLEAITTRWEATASRWEAIAISLE